MDNACSEIVDDTRRNRLSEIRSEEVTVAATEQSKEDDQDLSSGRTMLMLKETRYLRFCHRFWRILTLVSLAMFIAELLKSVHIFGQYPVASTYIITVATLTLYRLVYSVMLQMNNAACFNVVFVIFFVIMLHIANKFMRRNVISSALVCSCISTFIAYHRVSVYGDKPQLPQPMMVPLLSFMVESKDWTSWSHFFIVFFISFYAQECIGIGKPKDANLLDHFLSLLGDPIDKQEDAVHFQL